jgi:hypothetical protein
MTDKEPKILRVPSPGDGRRFEQITRAGKMTYAHYRPADALNPTETISYDRVHTKQGDGDAEVHLIPMPEPLWLLAGEPEEPGDLWLDVKSYIYAHVDFPNPRLYDVAAAWVFATWLKEASNIASYFRLYGTRNVGKTRCLEVFQRLCYRAVLTPSATESALYRLIQDYGVTLLLDESEIYGTELKQAVQNVLNAGYRRGQQVLRCEAAPDGSFIVTGFNTFGHKALASTELLKNTLESRCIPVIMQRRTRAVAFNVNDKQALKLRSRLLLWRLRRLANLDQTGEVSEDSEQGEGFLGGGVGVLHPIKDSRVIEIFAPLIALTIDTDAKRNIEEYALGVYEDNLEEDATSYEAEVLSSIIETRMNLESGKFSSAQVAELFNRDKADGERWDTRGVGRTIKKLGFQPRRMKGGKSGYVYDADQITRLSEKYDIPPPVGPSPTSLTSLTSPNDPAEPTPRPYLSERLTQLSEALQGTGPRGAKPDTLSEGTGIPIDETRQLLTILQRDRVAFAAPGDVWRWVA